MRGGTLGEVRRKELIRKKSGSDPDFLSCVVRIERDGQVLGAMKNARTQITGGKVMSGKTKRCANRAAQALRLAAAALRTSQSALGAYFYRICARMDKPKAITAAADKLARLIDTMLTKGEKYTDLGKAYDEERYRERLLRHLSQRASELGMQLITVPKPA
jgi:hypothetical protein